jgi:peptidoglycan/xylan/chitin deacetylase (PgdA/CDA1 family)
LDRFLWLRGELGLPVLTVLAFHRVTRPEDVGDLDAGVVESTPEDFAQQIDVIRNQCSVVSMADVRNHRRGRPLPKNPVLITFDDGYVDNLEIALPILERAGIPATFFIPTAFPEAGRLFWWDKIALYLQRCRRERALVTYPTRLALEPLRDPGRAHRRLCWAVKRTRALSLERLWEGLEEATYVHLDPSEERAIAERTIMSWPDIRRMRDAGMDVQSHSHEHRVLDTLTLEEATADLRLSREILSEALGEPVYALAYPVGHDLEGPFRRIAHDAGFELAFTNATGLCVPRSDPWNLPRLSMDREHVGALYKLRLVFGDNADPKVLHAPTVTVG